MSGQLPTRRTGRRRTRLGCLTLVSLTVPTVGLSDTAHAAENDYRTSATVIVRSGPSTSAESIGLIFDGTDRPAPDPQGWVSLLCQEPGTDVNGNDTWDYVEYTVLRTGLPKRGYVSDYYVDTGFSGPVPGVPQGDCAGGSAVDQPDPPATVVSNRLAVGQVLVPGAEVVSSSGQYRLRMQHDGNLVLLATAGDRPLWDSGTAGSPGATATLQPDGNLVVSLNGTAVWGADAHGRGGTYLEVQDDRNVVIYRDDRTAAWATDTMRTDGWIEWAQWYGADDAGTRLTLSVRRTGQAIHGPLDLQSAFDEALAKAPPYRDYENWVYRSLYAQFRCHDDDFRSRRLTFLLGPWDLDDWRHEVPYDRMTDASCNPVGPGITQPPFDEPAP